MKPSEFENWRRELLECSNIVQDDDDSVSDEEAERRFDRFIELLEMVEGTETSDVFYTLIDSIQPLDDYGAYQRVYGKLWSFPAASFGQWFVNALPNLLSRYGDDAGQFLCGITGPGREKYLEQFNHALSEAPIKTQQIIMAFVQRQEHEGWFEDDQGAVRPRKLT